MNRNMSPIRIRNDRPGFIRTSIRHSQTENRKIATETPSYNDEASTCKNGAMDPLAELGKVHR
ncbi:MAG: hypothetical protein ACI9PP_002283 [Halobacteriales archaeon]|jgi:hypothetical protein